MYPKELLLEIVEIAREHELMIFSDEIYDRLVFDGIEHTSIAVSYTHLENLICDDNMGIGKFCGNSRFYAFPWIWIKRRK